MKHSALIFFLIASPGILGNAVIASELVIDNPHFGDKGWDVQLSAGIYSQSDTLFRFDEDHRNGLFIPLEANWYGDEFYFSLGQEEGLLFGYTLNKNEAWALDVIAGPRSGSPNIDELESQFVTLDERDIDFHAGLRYTQYGDDNRLRVELTRDVSGTHDGYIANGSFKQEWQAKNWILTAGAALLYVSDEVAGYYFDVSSSESGGGSIPVYSAGDSTLANFSLAADYPISEKWVFNTRLNHTIYDDEVTNSPFTTDKNAITHISAAAVYHF